MNFDQTYIETLGVFWVLQIVPLVGNTETLLGEWLGEHSFPQKIKKNVLIFHQPEETGTVP